MQHIDKDPRYAEAQNTLVDLSAAFAAATAEESRLLGRLAAPANTLNHLEAGLRLLRGEPAQRHDGTGLNRDLAQVRERLDTLRPAVEQQRAVVATVRSELSAAANARAQPAHTKAAQGVADALLALHAALGVEAAVRTGIEASGFVCSLPALHHPELNFADSQTPVSRLLADIRRHQEVQALESTDALNVRLLVAVAGCGECGDVVRMQGREAAALVRIGQAERTSAKPSKAPRPQAATELVLS